MCPVSLGERPVAVPRVSIIVSFTLSITAEFLEADSQVGGHEVEVSLCKVEGQPKLPLRGWLAGIAVCATQRELRGDFGRRRDAIGRAGDCGFLRHGRAQSAGDDDATFLAGRFERKLHAPSPARMRTHSG